MQVKRYVLNGSAMPSMKEFYDEIAKVVPLPDYFGRNLDALADILTTNVEGPLELVWEHARLAKKSLKGDYAKIAAMLKHVAAERDDFTVSFRE